MSKHVRPKKHNASSTSRYSSPLEMLDDKTRKFQPKKITENNAYEQLCRQGECGLFEIPPSLYRYFYIHKETSIDTLEDLIEYASTIRYYTIDTEGQTRPKQSSIPALIQIEFLAENSSSIIILIETMHLPPRNSDKFIKMKKLCQTILSNNHHVYSWGNATHELLTFSRYDLFESTDLDHIIPVDVQPYFQQWFHRTDPFSSDRKLNPGNAYGLQFAIKRVFNEWLDKRMTLASWGCGIDWELHTIDTHIHDTDIHQKRIHDEQEIRELMTMYAINDCFSVTKLAIQLIDVAHLKPPTPSYGRPTWVHEENEPIELEIHAESPTFIDCIHQQEEHDPNEYERQEGYEENELRTNDTHRDSHMVPTENDDHLIIMENQLEKKKGKNRRKNQRNRRNRYRIEVIRHIYYKFDENDVKDILIHSNIRFTNVNIEGRTLFVGVKNEFTRKRLDQLLTEDMLTEEHYERIRKRRNRKKTIKHK